MAPPSLETMPVELLTYTIATYLPAPDLFNLRLTNKYLEHQLFKAFAAEFFSKRQFMVSTESIEALVGISKHPSLSQYLEHIVIGLDDLSSTYLLPDPLSASAMGGNFPNQPPRDNLTYVMACQDQTACRTTGRFFYSLKLAFDNLTNLKTIGIRDYNARGRRGGTTWRSYGAVSIEKKTGYSIQHQTATGGHVFATIISALSCSVQKQVPNIEVIMRRNGGGLGDADFLVNGTSYETLQGLETLLLAINSDQTEPFAVPSYALNADIRCKNILHFLSHCDNLKHLRLNFPARLTLGAQRPDHFFGVITSNWPQILPPPLKTLDLGGFQLDYAVILAFIDRLASTLRTIHLWKVILEYQANTAVYDSDDEANPFQYFLQHMSKPHINLETISVGFLSQVEIMRRPSQRIKFAPFPGATFDQSKDVCDFSLTGDDKDYNVSEAIKRVMIDPLAQPIVHSDSESSGDDQDEDMDEEDMEDEDGPEEDMDEAE